MPTLIRAKEVARKRGISKSKLYSDIAEGKFPAGIKLSPRVVVWREEEVDAAIEKELAEALQKERDD